MSPLVWLYSSVCLCVPKNGQREKWSSRWERQRQHHMLRKYTSAPEEREARCTDGNIHYRKHIWERPTVWCMVQFFVRSDPGPQPCRTKQETQGKGRRQRSGATRRTKGSQRQPPEQKCYAQFLACWERQCICVQIVYKWSTEWAPVAIKSPNTFTLRLQKWSRCRACPAGQANCPCALYWTRTQPDCQRFLMQT